jgi:hypothetical protein
VVRLRWLARLLVEATSHNLKIELFTNSGLQCNLAGMLCLISTGQVLNEEMYDRDSPIYCTINLFEEDVITKNTITKLY